MYVLIFHSWHGNSLMGTRLNFSEADSISVNRNSSFHRKPMKKLSKDYQPYSYCAPQESFSVLEEESLSVSNAHEPVKPLTQNVSSRMLRTSRPLQELEPSNTQSFVAFEDPSMSSVSILDPSMHHDPPSRDPYSRDPPLHSSHKDSRSLPRVPLGSLVDSKRKVLQEIKVPKMEDPQCSFSVRKEDDSIEQSIKELCTSDREQGDKEVINDPPSSARSNKEQEIGFTEYDIPSCSLYEPTSTPTAKRTGTVHL